MSATMIDNQNRDIKTYIVTEPINPDLIPKDRVLNDLDFLKKAEFTTVSKSDLIGTISKPNVSQVVRALRLANPFRGY